MGDTSTAYLTAESVYEEAQIDYALDKLEELPDELFVPLFSAWANKNRYIPEGISDWSGWFDIALTPHLKEILDRLHPDDPVRIVTVLKSVQSALTTTVAENAIGAYIRYRLGSILFVTSTKNIGNIRGSANIDTLIDNSGLGKYLMPFSNRNNRKNKDNTLYKEFIGNLQLMITSYQSIADAKTNKFNLIVEDELDEAPAELKDQGDTEEILKGRTFGVIDYKILQLSTSKRANKSRIWKNYFLGDQRKYNVPCPVCGENQVLVLKSKKDNFGLTFDRETDKKTGKKTLIPESIRYISATCGHEWRESKKRYVMKNGVWIATAVPEDIERTSYHCPGLISSFLPWRRICQGFINTRFGNDLLKFKDFTINTLGNPWLDVKKAVDWKVLKERAEDYCMGEVPSGEMKNINGIEIYTGALLIYGGTDVHIDRLELHVVGFGYNGEKWTIDYKVFYGNTKDLNDPCWLALHNYVYNTEFKVCGKSVIMGICAIDCGYDPRKADKRDKDYNNKAHVVYEFVSKRSDRFVAVMGTPDEKAIGIIKEGRIHDDKTTLTKRYMVAVSLLKDSIMNIIENRVGYNTIHVPRYNIVEGEKVELPDDWYMQFLSEQYKEDPKKPGKYGWYAFHRNEVLDTFNYAWAASAVNNISSWTDENWRDYYLSILED